MDRIEDCISFLVGKAAQRVTRRARDLLAPHGVTPVQYAVLKVLAGSEGLSGMEIGARLVMDSASVTGILDRLETAGLAERRADPKDRRAQRIVTTERAEGLIAALDAAMDQLNEEAAGMLGGQDKTVRRGLRALGEEKRWVHDV